MVTNFDIKSWSDLYKSNYELAIITLFSSLKNKELILSDDDFLVIWSILGNFDQIKLASIVSKKTLKRITKDDSILSRIVMKYKSEGKLAAAKLYREIKQCSLRTAIEYGNNNKIW